MTGGKTGSLSFILILAQIQRFPFHFGVVPVGQFNSEGSVFTLGSTGSHLHSLFSVFLSNLHLRISPGLHNDMFLLGNTLIFGKQKHKVLFSTFLHLRLKPLVQFVKFLGCFKYSL